jgi:hypothetical protein
MLQILLEDVWNNELGPDVHIGVHPVQTRNYYKGIINEARKCSPTLEGTHRDSTERVCVIMFERHNVAEGSGKTSLYPEQTPMGLRRDNPEHEKTLGPLRLAEHVLKEPLEAITFDDTNFKHDVSDFSPDDPSEKSWRSVVLIMARKPLSALSPVDGLEIDGMTPASIASQSPAATD